MVRRFTSGAAIAMILTVCGAAKAGDSPEVQELWEQYSRLKKEKKYQEAAGRLDLINEIGGPNANAWCEGAWILNELGKYTEAADAAATALKINPNHAGAWMERGYSRLKERKYKDAVVALTTCLKKNRQCWAAYDYLAEALDRLDEPELAAGIRANKAAEKAKAAPVTRRID